MIGTGPFRLRRYVEAERRARPEQRVLGRARAARRGEDHVLPGQRAVGARAAGRADRPRDAALRRRGPLQEQLEIHLLLAPTAPPAGVHANRRRPVPRPRVRRAVALTINRPQQTRRVMLGQAQVGNDNVLARFVSSDRSTKQRTQNLELARALLRAAGRESEVHAHDVELPRPHRPRRVDPGVRAPGGHRRGHRGHGRVEVLRLGAAGADYATTTPWLNRPATLTEYEQAQHLHHALLHVDR